MPYRVCTVTEEVKLIKVRGHWAGIPGRVEGDRKGQEKSKVQGGGECHLDFYQLPAYLNFTERLRHQSFRAGWKKGAVEAT